MSIKSNYLKLFANATEKAACGAMKFIGKNNKTAAEYWAQWPVKRSNLINI